MHQNKGATGEAVEGYTFLMSNMFLFGKEFKDVPVLTYDFKNFPSVEGLIGWGLIKRLHLEMNGPDSALKIF